MPTLAAISFSILDWSVLLGYFAILAVTGWWFSRKELEGAREYFLANRQMPMWAVAISVLATSTSAATFIGSPEEGYARNLTYLSTNIGGVLAVLIVARFFIPIYYKHNVMTVYHLLEVRFGHSAKEASSWMFMIGRVMASGSRLFMAAIPLSLILFHETKDWQLLTAIAVLTLVGIFYTLVGGIRSIIYTDVIQFGVFILAAVAAIVVLLVKIPAPIGEVWSALASAKAPDGSAKLSILRFDTDPSVEYTVFTAAIGFAMLNLASYGTDHDIAQRMLTCKSALEGSRSVIVAILLNLPMQLIFLSIGVLLWVFYTRPDLMGGSAAPAPEKSGEVFVRFILDHMPSGMAGVMMAGLFAAGLGSFNSALNAMGATFVNDVYAKRVRNKSDRHYLVVGRWAVVIWGVILGAFAGVCVWWQKGSGETLISFALGIMTFAYAGLLAVFLTALFTRRGNSASAIAALAVGFLATLIMQPMIWNAIPLDALPDMTVAWPWRFVIATALALAVCLAGRSPAHSTHLRGA